MQWQLQLHERVFIEPYTVPNLVTCSSTPHIYRDAPQEGRPCPCIVHSLYGSTQDLCQRAQALTLQLMSV